MVCHVEHLPPSAYELSGIYEVFAPPGYLFDDELSSLICDDFDDVLDRVKDVGITLEKQEKSANGSGDKGE